jgi:glucosylceramidase
MRAVCLSILSLPVFFGCSSPAGDTTGGGDAAADAAPAEDSAAPPPQPEAGAPGADASTDAATYADAHGPDASRADAAPPPPAPPAAYLTTDDLSQHLQAVALTLGDGGSPDVTVTIDPTTTYQSILGFGASITDSSSYVMTKYLSAAALTQLLTALFDPGQGVGLTFLRQPMGASDFSTVGDFSYDDGASDPSLASFSIAQDLKATIPVLKQVLGIAPDLFILGTPWSPPAWMKNNASMDGTGKTGGSSGLAGSAYVPFGNYFVKFVQAYAQQGVVVGAVTPENEPLNGSANYPAMDLNAPSELALIAQDMGPAFQAASLKTEIWAYDHNWDVESYPAQVISDATAGGFTEGAAFHCYAGDASAMTTFHQAFPQKSVYMTECSGGDWQSDAFANTIDLALQSTQNWARVISLWNMALDENKGPQNGGCSTCRGVVTVDSTSGQITYNADYYALGHFAKFVRPGAVRVASNASGGSISQVAFRNPDGRMALVAHNTGGGTTTLGVIAGGATMTVSVPANAAVTVTWAP